MRLFSATINEQNVTLSIIEQEGRCFNKLVLRSGLHNKATSLVFECDSTAFKTIGEGVEFVKADRVTQIKYMNKRYPNEVRAIEQLEEGLNFCNSLLGC